MIYKITDQLEVVVFICWKLNKIQKSVDFFFFYGLAIARFFAVCKR